MTKSVVIFRADGHHTMGLGHLVRSTALAAMLAPDFECHLVYKHCPPQLLADSGEIYSTSLVLAPNATPQQDVHSLIAYGYKIAADRHPIFVLDGYHFDTAYQQAIVDTKARLVCIDDIHACHYLAHLIINHAPSARITDYSAAPYTHFALGLRFALLRKPFQEIASQTNENAEGVGIFICLGGADPDNATLMVLKQLDDQGVQQPIDLVIGAAYRFEQELSSFLRDSTLGVKVHKGASAEAMAAMIATSTIGITSPSTVSLEYLCGGGQLYLHQIADNQTEIRAALIEQGMAKDFSQFTVTTNGVSTTDRRPAIDGLQGIRFRKLFAGLGITLRKAQSQDSQRYFDWANDPNVRAQSFNSAPISLSQHESWFAAKLTDPDSVLLVFESNSNPIGQVRFHLDSGIATIGYSVAESARGMGLGLAMLHFGTNYLSVNHSGTHTVRGYIKESNVASLVTLRRLGYTEFPTEDYPNAIKFELYEF